MSDKPLTVGQLQRALDRLVIRDPKAADRPVALVHESGNAEWLDHVPPLPVHGWTPDAAAGDFVELVGREGPMS